MYVCCSSNTLWNIMHINVGIKLLENKVYVVCINIYATKAL